MKIWNLFQKDAKEKIFQEIDKLVKDYELRINTLERENEKLKSDEKYKDLEDQLSHLKKMCIVELASDKELERYKAFAKMSGGDNHVYIRQSGTGIGVCTYLENDKGEKFDITDTSVW